MRFFAILVKNGVKMEQLIEKFRRKLLFTDTRFVRSIIHKINWNSRLIGIKGARGVGKSTLLLQYIKLNLMDDINSVLYVSLDNLWFIKNSLTDLVDNFAKNGGKFLFLDEVHKYKDWSVEIKNIYDDYPEIKIVFTGSSLLEILNARADLSRRAITYIMQGLSFREYFELSENIKFDIFSLEDLLAGHFEISNIINEKIKPIKHFKNYLKFGYYPYFVQGEELYHQRLEEVINFIIEIELPQLQNININYINKIKQLLMIISESVPFIPNISKISQKISVNRETLLNYIYYLNEANILFSAFYDNKGISLLQKPDKIFLENTNQIYALMADLSNPGSIRETFFANQIKYYHKINISKVTDFIVDNKYSFEIGGKQKNNKQLQGLKDSFIAADDIEFGFGNKIPLWLFGFLY